MLSSCAVPALPSSIALSIDYASSVGSWTLQMPACFLIGRNGTIGYGAREVIGFRSVFEDLNYEELKRRANARLPDRGVPTLEARGKRRSVAEGERLYGVDDHRYPFVYVISATLQVRDPDGLV